MTLRHLRIFRQVWREGSVTKAAAVLGITQPSASVAISELEEFYQVKLFDRISRKLFLTPTGEKLLEYSNTILNQFDESVNLIRGTDIRKCLKVGISSNFATIYAPPATEEFNKRLPDIKLTTYAYVSSTIIDLLNRREVDIGILDCDIPDNINSQELCRDDFVLLCSKDFAATLPKTVSPEDMKGLNIIYPNTPGSTNRPLADWMNKKKIESNVVMYTTSSHAMNTMAYAGLAALPMLRALANDRIKYFPDFSIIEFREDRPELVYKLCTLKGKNIDAAMRAYIDIMLRLTAQ